MKVKPKVRVENENDDGEDKGGNKRDKQTMIVGANAVVDKWTVVIHAGHTAITVATVFAAQWANNTTGETEALLDQYTSLQQCHDGVIPSCTTVPVVEKPRVGNNRLVEENVQRRQHTEESDSEEGRRGGRRDEEEGQRHPHFAGRVQPEGCLV